MFQVMLDLCLKSFNFVIDICCEFQNITYFPNMPLSMKLMHDILIKHYEIRKTG